MRVSNIVYRICIFVVAPLNVKSFTSPCILRSEPTCSIVWKYITFSNFVGREVTRDLPDPPRRKLEFDTRFKIKPKDPTFSWFTEPCYSFRESIHLKV